MIEVSPSHQLLSAAQIYKMFSISKTTFYRWIDEGFFEPGLRLGPNCVRWRASTVNAFIKSVFGNFSFYSYKKACGQKKTVRGSKNSRRLSNGTPAI